jgi:hypothetical protein
VCSRRRDGFAEIRFGGVNMEHALAPLFTLFVGMWLGYLIGRGHKRKVPRLDTHYAKFKVLPIEELPKYVKP